jgi:predicted nucleic-acid-binding Zn-ribbon protein
MPVYNQYKCKKCGNTTFEIFDQLDRVGEDSPSGWEFAGVIVRCSKCHYDTGWDVETTDDDSPEGGYCYIDLMPNESE